MCQWPRKMCYTQVYITYRRTANLPFSIPCIPVIARPILLIIYNLYPLCTWSYTHQINFKEIGSVFSKIFVPKIWLTFFIFLQKFWANQKQPLYGSISFKLGTPIWHFFVLCMCMHRKGRYQKPIYKADEFKSSILYCPAFS